LRLVAATRSFTWPHVVGADGRPLDTVVIEALSAESVIGLYPSERTRRQRIIIDAALHLDLSGVATDRDLSKTVDYARLAGELRFIAEHCELELLETAAHAIAAYILAAPTQDAKRAQVAEVTLRLSKPSALPDGAMPAVIVHRRATDMHMRHEDKPWGRVDVVYETQSCGIYRLRIRSGGQIPTHIHQVLRESELVIGSGLHVQGKPVKRGTAHVWPHGYPHRYDNPSAIEQSILCIDKPAFIPLDEIVVDEKVTSLTSENYYPDEDSA
jgi:FolB domain-containing protein